jgi:hypothetical protein
MKKMAVLTRITLGAVIALTMVTLASTPVKAAESDVTAKLQAAVADLSAAQQASLYLLLKQLQGGGEGDTTASATVSPEEAGAAVVNGFFEAAGNEDIDAMMSYFSEDFDHYEYGDKEGIKDFLSQAIDMGYMDGIESSTEDAEYEVEGDELTIYPVDVTGAFGAITFEYILKKEGSDWKIIGFDAAGL